MGYEEQTGSPMIDVWLLDPATVYRTVPATALDVCSGDGLGRSRFSEMSESCAEDG